MKRTPVFIGMVVGLAGVHCAGADELPELEEAESARLETGEAVILDHRPDEAGEADGRFVTVARRVPGTRDEVWAVISDKEDPERFFENMLESRILRREGDRLLVEQRTRVGGPKDSYLYRLWYRFEPKRRIDFTYEGGELRDIEGAYWLFEGAEPNTCVVVYSLHIDPGLFAPQIVVKRGMRKTMPDTLACIRDEVVRRRNAGGE